MKKYMIKEIKTTRINFDGGYYVDITPSEQKTAYFDFWLYQKNSGCSLYMFGCKEEPAKYNLIDLAVANADEYINDFIKQYGQ